MFSHWSPIYSINWILKLNQLTALQTDDLRVLWKQPSAKFCAMSAVMVQAAQRFHHHRLEGRLKIINRAQLARGPVNNELCFGLLSFLEPLRYMAHFYQKVIVFQRWKRQYMETRLSSGSSDRQKILSVWHSKKPDRQWACPEWIRPKSQLTPQKWSGLEVKYTLLREG